MTDTSPFTWQYALSGVMVGAGIFIVPITMRAVWVTVIRWRDRWIQRHIDEALTNVRYLPTARIPRQETSR